MFFRDGYSFFFRKWILIHITGYSDVETHLDSPLPFTIPSWIIVQALKILRDRKLKADANSRLDCTSIIPQHQLIHRAMSMNSKQKNLSKQASQVVLLQITSRCKERKQLNF